METKLEIKLVPLEEAINWFWQDNPKKHNIPQLIEAISTYGFQLPPKFDGSLRSQTGNGAFSRGNGRVQALWQMCQQADPPPSGIAINDDGDWYLPVMFGNDILSQELAEAFAVDDNNLTMAGGISSAIEVSALHDQAKYEALLHRLEKSPPVTLNEESLDILLDRLPAEGQSSDDLDDWGYTAEDLPEINKEIREEDVKPADLTVIVGKFFAFKVDREVYFEWLEEIRQAVGFDEASIKQEILNRLELTDPLKETKIADESD